MNEPTREELAQDEPTPEQEARLSEYVRQKAAEIREAKEAQAPVRPDMSSGVDGPAMREYAPTTISQRRFGFPSYRVIG
jgi:hypothetical protein